jgi:hypothetical protein
MRLRRSAPWFILATFFLLASFCAAPSHSRGSTVSPQVDSNVPGTSFWSNWFDSSGSSYNNSTSSGSDSGRWDSGRADSGSGA